MKENNYIQFPKFMINDKEVKPMNSSLNCTSTNKQYLIVVQQNKREVKNERVPN